MTTQVATIGNVGGTRVPRRPSLEELVDRLIAALFPEQGQQAAQTVARSVHDARRLRQTGDLDGALAVFAGVNTAKTMEQESRWAYAEWQAPGAAQVRRPGSAGLQPGHGQGCAAGAVR